jgi:large subunit ribosomal protein L17
VTTEADRARRVASSKPAAPKKAAPAEKATEATPKAEPTKDETTADEATTAPAEESASTEDAPYGAGSHAALPDGGEPEGFPVKGNDSSKLYHLPGTSHYDRTVAEVWFVDADAAEAAGFALPPSQREDEDGS